jgi:Zn-dependent peptidase ImmA (M78 family)
LVFVPMTGRLADTAGFLDPVSKAIYVNEADPPTRQLFTVAHELGHYLLRHKPEQLTVLTRSAVFDGASLPIERDANTFAAEFLMPEEMVRDAMRQYGLGEKQPNTLAALFGVSAEAMRYRLRNLALA